MQWFVMNLTRDSKKLCYIWDFTISQCSSDTNFTNYIHLILFVIFLLESKDQKFLHISQNYLENQSKWFFLWIFEKISCYYFLMKLVVISNRWHQVLSMKNNIILQLSQGRKMFDSYNTPQNSSNKGLVSLMKPASSMPGVHERPKFQQQFQSNRHKAKENEERYMENCNQNLPYNKIDRY